MIVTVHEVAPQGSVAIGIGTDEDGREVRFGGDHRPMSYLAEHIEAEGPTDVEIEDWQVLSVSRAA